MDFLANQVEGDFSWVVKLVIIITTIVRQERIEAVVNVIKLIIIAVIILTDVKLIKAIKDNWGFRLLNNQLPCQDY